MQRKSRNTKQKELLNEELNKFNSVFTAEDLLIKSRKPCVYCTINDAV
jgi:hypothetical protein